METNIHLATLNSAQLSAVTYSDGSILILAGAGSGKTKVLTTRIGWLVQNNAVAPHEILAVTFTNKAAKEMLHRVSSILAIDTKYMWIGTFHSIALRLLSKHYQHANLPAHFQILDQQDQLSILKRIIKASNIDEERYSAKELQKFINYHKEHGTRAKSIAVEGLRQKIWVDLYIKYEELCNQDGLVDFTELLLRSYEMLFENKQILSSYQEQFQHMLVDEFQDTNQLQYRWLKLLAGPNSCIFAVGDDDQSIYSFRGARVANMQLFVNDFEIKDPIRLEQNYRSTPNILAAANAVIDNNRERIGKKLWTEKAHGDKIRLYEGYTEEDEAYFIADEIKTLHQSGVKLSDIAILYRSNAQSRVFEQLFYNRNIAYRVYGGLRFFDRQEIKHMLSYLRLILNSHDNEAFLRVVNFPARGIGSKTIENLQTLSQTHSISLFSAVELVEGKSRQNLNKFTDLIKQMQGAAQIMTLAKTVSHVLETSGMYEVYLADKKNGNERLENLNELVNFITNFKPEDNNDNSLATFLAQAVLESTDSQAEKYEQSVQLMTVHAAKGLEFKVVFVVGLEDGLFPHENCFAEPRDLEEERRLMYVAITRSQERLYLLRACSRLMWGKRQSAPISRFVNEIPSELISNISGISKIGCSNLSEYGNHESSNNYISFAPIQVDNPETKISRISLSDQNMTLKIGDMVKHAKFGNGKIINLNVDGGKMTAEIFFIGMGKKTLDLNVAKIEKS